MNKTIRENVRYSPSKLISDSLAYPIVDTIEESVGDGVWNSAGKYIRNAVGDTVKPSIEIPIANCTINYFHQKWINQ
jgi:hypothetical protein